MNTTGSKTFLILILCLGVTLSSCGNSGGGGSGSNASGGGGAVGPFTETVLVSRTSGGTNASGGNSTAPSVSPDGRFIAFQSRALNLGGPSGIDSIYIHDRDVSNDGTFDQAGDIATVLVSKTSGGAIASGGNSAAPSLSPDGRFIAFQSRAINLSGTSGIDSIYIHDRDTDENGIFDEL